MVFIMAVSSVCLPEHELMIGVISGAPSGADFTDTIRAMGPGCAVRWLIYFNPTSDLSRVDVAHLPTIRSVMEEKRKELFGNKPKAIAVVCASESSQQYVIFWQRYDPLGFVGVFRTLDEAYGSLGLPDRARAAVARAIEDSSAAEPAARQSEPSLTFDRR